MEENVRDPKERKKKDEKESKIVTKIVAHMFPLQGRREAQTLCSDLYVLW